MSSRAVSIAARNLFRRFGRNRKGSAAVEFALVAPVFIALLFAILETGIMFFAGQYLQTITQDGARIIMTGQAQNGNYTKAQFQTLYLQPGRGIVQLQQYLRQRAELFVIPDLDRELPDQNGTFVNSNQYSPGGPGSVVIVQLFYQWPQIVTGLGYNITNLNGNYRLLWATAAFKNEPYPSSS